MPNRKVTNYIVIHCSATRPSLPVDAKEIRRWHKAKGWADIGYHYVIKRDGVIEKGRSLLAIGAHVEGHNSTSVGVCMVGGVEEDNLTPDDNFTAAQWASLEKVVGELVKTFPAAKVLGHRDFPGVRKACPCFAAKIWAKGKGFPV